ncbi:MAG: prolipoprotein diacylglyceryl transferase family protein [Sphingomonas sp.]
MTDVIHLGPLALATDRLLAIGGIWAFLLLMMLIDPHRRQPTSRAGWIAIVIGLVVARLAYVAFNWRAFSTDWSTVFAFWQGGFALWPGAITAGLSLLFTLRDNRTCGRAIIALVVCVFGFSAMQIMIQQPSRPLPKVAAFHRLDGQSVSIDAYRGKSIVINLWATWCPPCRRELPMLADVAKTSPVPILLIDQGEDAARVSAFLAQQKIAGDAVLLDPQGTLSTALGNGVFPTTLFVDSNGAVTATHIGEISRAALLSRIAKLQKDKT